MEREYGEFMGDDTLENGCCPHVYSALSTIQCATPKHFSPLKLKHGECRDPSGQSRNDSNIKASVLFFFFSHQQYFKLISAPDLTCIYGLAFGFKVMRYM